MKLRQASVCTGLGAAELAASCLGWENVFMSEIDDFCRRILSYHFPKAKLYGDFTKENFREYRGLIDVFTAGFPCQPFSVSGERKGAADHRHLWPHVYRLVDEFRPPWFIGENVAGITSMVFPSDEIEVESQSNLFEAGDKETILEENYILESICRDLESIGYSVQPFIVPACAIEAPHRRDRIWIVANYSDTGTQNVREWENGIFSEQTTPNANGYDAGRCGHGEVGCPQGENEEKQKERKRIRPNSERIGDKETFTNSGSKQFQNRTQEHYSENRKKDKSRMDNRNKRFSNSGIIADSYKFDGNISGFCTGKISQFKTSGIWSDNWRNFPTQSPICSRNDGISDLLDSDSLLNGKKPRQPWQAYGKWRSESIKGFGNAIVPQVLCQFFEIIDRIESNF